MPHNPENLKKLDIIAHRPSLGLLLVELEVL